MLLSGRGHNICHVMSVWDHVINVLGTVCINIIFIIHETECFMQYTGTSTRASCHVYCIKHEDFSCYNYVFYITTTPYLPCNNINRKELYDFYYTAITLTTL